MGNSVNTEKPLISVGQKIKRIRKMRGLTQKELGLAVGFDEESADIRIAQYESNTRTPKEKVVINIADAYTDALGNRIKPDYLSGEFPKYLVKNGFNRMRFHDLRHSCASLLLANGVSLKQIQDWLGHSTFTITADIYAHLDYKSKIASAGAMTWIDNTSLAQGIPANENQATGNTVQALPEFLNGLFATGVSPEVIQAWLRQTDFTALINLGDCFKEFTQMYSKRQLV